MCTYDCGVRRHSTKSRERRQGGGTPRRMAAPRAQASPQDPL